MLIIIGEVGVLGVVGSGVAEDCLALSSISLFNWEGGEREMDTFIPGIKIDRTYTSIIYICTCTMY